MKTIYCILIPFLLYAQVDSTRQYLLKTVVVTADKLENNIFLTPSSVSSVNFNDLNVYPVRGFEDLSAFIPGIYTYSVDGLGFMPVVSARGFYGAGEAEYISFMLNGTELNDLESGLVNWNFYPYEIAGRTEVLRGGSSSLYGDAAIGGVINVIYNYGEASRSLFLSGGSFNSFKGTAALSGMNYNIYAKGVNSSGFREHSEHSNYLLGGSYKAPFESSSLTLSLYSQFYDQSFPGYIPSNSGLNRTESLAYFKNDGRKDKRILFAPVFHSKLDSLSSYDIKLKYQHRNSETTNSILNSAYIIDPQTFMPAGIYDTTLFGDTKRREFVINQIGAGSDLRISKLLLNDRFILGAEADYGSYTNRIFDIQSGFERDYSAGTSEAPVVDGRGSRLEIAAYFNEEIVITDYIKLTLGLRYDFIKDSYDTELPDTSFRIENRAFSPKAGINFLLTDLNTVYFNFNRSFKSPTVDQLTGLSKNKVAFFMPTGSGYQFIPFEAAPFSNAELKPQTSLNFEIGTKNMFILSSETSAELSAAGYLITVDDEIDFNLSTFRYENILKTRHLGVESQFRLLYKSLTLFLNYSFNCVKFLEGGSKDYYLKGIPRHVSNLGVSYRQQSFFTSAILRYRDKIFLDDNNLESLEGVFTADMSAGYDFGIITMKLDVFNVFNKEYFSNGYSLDGMKFLLPAAPRSFLVSAEVKFR